jgi:hypothetical protein
MILHVQDERDIRDLKWHVWSLNYGDKMQQIERQFETLSELSGLYVSITY